MNEDQTQGLEQLDELPINDKVVFQPIEEMEDGADIIEDDNYREIDDDDETDYTLAYKEWAESYGIEIDEDEVIEDEDTFNKKIGDYYIKKRYGDNNPFLDLAETNVDLKQVMDTYAQYDQVIAMEDGELYVSSQATNELQNAIQNNPSLANNAQKQQEFYQNAYNHYAEKIKGADSSVVKSLADPVRKQYVDAKNNLIPSLKERQIQLAKQEEEVYEATRKNIIDKVKKEPFFADDNNAELVDYFTEMTSLKNGKSPIVEKFNNDMDFFRKVIEFSYLEENGLLEKAFTKKVLKTKRVPPKLRNSKGSVGLRMIDTSKKH